MYVQVEKPKENKSRGVASSVAQKKSGGKQGFGFVDNRPEAIAQGNLQKIINNSPQAKQAAQLEAMTNYYSASQQQPIQKKENNTGLPDDLKSGIENLSGYSMDDVKVHYNFDKPVQLQAHAYAQGTDIYITTGQEKHLPHEAWHEVLQKQGKVQPTFQFRNEMSINDDTGFEKEADELRENTEQVVKSVAGSAYEVSQRILGPSIKAPLLKTSMLMESSNSPVQRKKSHAEAFINENKLSIDGSYLSVKTYVENTSNPEHLRQGLLRAWNKSQIPRYSIATPVDLQAISTSFTPMGDLGGWDSDDEDRLNLDQWQTHLKKGKVDLIRSGKTADKSGAPEMDFFDAIRFGRQANKRDEYHRLPMTVDLGGHHIEYDNPGTKDIYATPLDKVTSSQSSKRKKFKRAGKSSDYNWKNLSRNLDRMEYKDRQERQMQMLRFFLRPNELLNLDPYMAEALAAIGSDLMKGSKGGRFYLRRTLRSLQNLQKSKADPSFSDVFSGKSPLYEPAAIGGRSLVSKMNSRIQIEANQLLEDNNCLINAIALAAGRPVPTLGQLMAIRERIGSYGDMLLATNETVGIIREVLEINTAIAVIYQDRESEDFPGVGEPLLIYHVNGNHFTHQMPHKGYGKNKLYQR